MSDLGLLVVLTSACVAGLIVAASGWLLPAPSLSRTLRHLQRPGTGDEIGTASVAGHDAGVDTSWRRRVARRLAAVSRGHPGLLPSQTQLRLLRRPLERHAVYLGSAALGGLVLPGLAITLLQRSGLLGLGWYAPLIVSLSSAALAPMLAHATTVEQAELVRTDLRFQVSAYLDLVTMLLAGNTGYEGALEQAARAGDGRLFEELRRGMRESTARGETLTDALRRTGVELGLDELEQVAATAALSAHEGAPVARTLAAKCATLRSALATEQESEARLRTSRLTTPVVGMALIFMALVIYPALSFS